MRPCITHVPSRGCEPERTCRGGEEWGRVHNYENKSGTAPSACERRVRRRVRCKPDSHGGRVAVLLNGHAQFPPVHVVGDAKCRAQLRVTQAQQHLHTRRAQRAVSMRAFGMELKLYLLTTFTYG